MANVITIDYLYRDNGEITDLLFHIASSNVGFDWSSEKSRITIYWEPYQEEEVKKLLELVSKRFKEPTIIIKNEASYEYSEEEDTNVKSISQIEVTSTIVCESSEDEPSFEETIEDDENPEIISEEISVEEVVISDETNIIEAKEECPTETIANDASINENVYEESTNEEKSSKETEVIEEISTEETVTEDVDRKVDEDTSSKVEVSKEELHEKLKQLFDGDSKYTFKEPEKDAEELCTNLEIKNETVKYALILTNASLTRDSLISRLAKKFHKNNTALAGVALRGNFKKMMENKYPEILKEYPQINVFDFLNVFRKEDKQI